MSEYVCNTGVNLWSQKQLAQFSYLHI